MSEWRNIKHIQDGASLLSLMRILYRVTNKFNIQHDVEVIYTRKKETADERIEKLTNELKGRKSKFMLPHRYDGAKCNFWTWSTYENQHVNLKLKCKLFNRKFLKSERIHR